MTLEAYDGQCLRIADSSGNVFEGVCAYHNAAYAKQEYGRKQEALQMANFVFFQSDIREIQSLEQNQGQWGKFSAPYGQLEEWNVQEGIDCIQDVLFSEEEVHVYRMLCCLEDYIAPDTKHDMDCGEALPKVLQELLDTRISERCREKAEKIIALCKYYYLLPV